MSEDTPMMGGAPAPDPNQAPVVNYGDESPDGAPVATMEQTEAAPAAPDMVRPMGVDPVMPAETAPTAEQSDSGEKASEEAPQLGQVAIDAQVEAPAPEAQATQPVVQATEEKHGFLGGLFHRKK